MHTSLHLTASAVAGMLLAGCVSVHATVHKTTRPAPPAAPAAMASAAPEAGPVFDMDAYTEAARTLRGFDTGGAVRVTEWTDDTLVFTRLGTETVIDRATGAEIVPEPAEESEAEGDGQDDRRRGRGQRPRRGMQRDREASPDGRWSAVARDWNVVIEPAEGNDAGEIAVTEDGSRKLRYGKASWVYGEELGQTTAMWWSPDSAKLVYYAFDERDVPDFHLLRGWTELRPEPMLEGYPKPGEPNPVASLRIFDVASSTSIDIDTQGGLDLSRPGVGPDPWYVYAVSFTPGGDEVLFHRTNRHQNHLQVMAADLGTGATRLVVEERQETWQSNRPLMRFLADGERFVWETERSGVKRYELRRLDGSHLCDLTTPKGPVRAIERLDEEGGWLWYTAYSGANPINAHVHRVRLDGTDEVRLTGPGRSHAVEIAPDGRHYLLRAETLEEPPVTTLHAADGTLVATVAEPDRDAIAALGYPEPELFTCKAADGETDLYGWLYRPAGFDPSRRYPLLIDVYGGPLSQGVFQRYTVGRPETAFGFCVAKIDNRGTRGRTKAFEGASYLQLGVVDLDDQVAGVRHLLESCDYLDPERVGITGHSYGGYMSALAIVRYPDVFSAAAAGAPVTDWRNYDTIYTERFMRTPQENEAGYDAGSCMTYAKDLEGRLLILHGMVDDNVHPNNAWQLAEALQNADKDFEMMWYPNSGHGLARHSFGAKWRFLFEALVR